MDPTSPASSLACRLDRLERRNRLLSAAVGALLLLILLPAFTARDGKEVRAQRFVLVDAKDATRGTWGTDADGRGQFELFDGGTKPRYSVQVLLDDVVVALRDREGLVRCGMAVGVGGLPHVLLSDGRGRPRVHLSVNSADRGNLVVFGAEGVVAAGLGVLDTGEAWLRPDAATAAERKQEPAPPPTVQEVPAEGSTRRGR